MTKSKQGSSKTSYANTRPSCSSGVSRSLDWVSLDYNQNSVGPSRFIESHSGTVLKIMSIKPEIGSPAMLETSHECLNSLVQEINAALQLLNTPQSKL
jgi:hypothetical protein